MMIHISSLKNVPIESIVDCLSRSFAGYFVELSSDVNYWSKRFKNARVDYQLSWGVFDENKLVGFIMNAIDSDQGEKTAFNTGTGILDKYRGNRYVDQMYKYGIPILKENGITKCKLEVIDKNERAISVYERIGFKIKRKLNCYKGVVAVNSKAIITECSVQDLPDYGLNEFDYSWDNTMSTIVEAGKTYKTFEVFESDRKNTSIGYFIINPTNGYVAQLEAKPNMWKKVFSGISQISTEIIINNIDEKRQGLLEFIKHLGLKNTINQYEMEMSI